MKKERLFLIDANSYLYRAYYALPPRGNMRGKATTVVHGFTRMILRLIKRERPDYLAVAFDLPTPTVRRKRFVEFVAKRPLMPPDLKAQIPSVKQILQGFNIPTFEIDGFDADDVLATIAQKARRKELEIVLVTSFKDALQLADKIKILNPHQRDFIYDAQKVKERYNVEPRLIPELLALIGDKPENIPGAKGLGPKRASALLRQYGSLKNLLNSLDKLEGKLANSIRESVKQLRLGKRIATMDLKVPVEVELESLRKRPYDYRKLIPLFQKFGFASLLSEVLSHRHPKGVRYIKVLTESGLASLARELKGAREFCVDTETTSVDPIKGELVGISFSLAKGEAVYVPIGHAYPGTPKQLQKKKVAEALKPIFEDEDKVLIGQNIAFDLAVLFQAGIISKARFFDTMIASYLINPARLKHSLEALALEYLGYKMLPFKELVEKGRSIAEVDVDLVCEYACEDADLTLQLKKILNPILEGKGLEELFEKVEMPLVGILTSMQRFGVLVDTEFLTELSQRTNKEAKLLAKKIYSQVGEEFNLNSSAQLSKILFKNLKLKPGRRTRTGRPSTARSILERLARTHPIAAKIVEYRNLVRLDTGFIEPVRRFVNPETGRIHPSYNQAVAVTGRIVTRRPNLQNIPVRPEFAHEIRRAFVAPPGWFLLSADYSQIELRIVAHFTKDDSLISAFRQERDVHAETAARLFKKDIDKVTEEDRRRVKVVNFGVIYGMSARSLAAELGLSRKEAEDFLDSYFEQHPKIAGFIRQALARAHREKEVRTILSRVRPLPAINTPNRQLRAMHEREAVNTPIQGSASDIIKVAMVRIAEAFKEERLKARMILQVHDELLFEVPEDELIRVKDLVKDIMENVVKLDVPLKVKLGVGRNWLDLEYE